MFDHDITVTTPISVPQIVTSTTPGLMLLKTTFLPFPKAIKLLSGDQAIA